MLKRPPHSPPATSKRQKIQDIHIDVHGCESIVLGQSGPAAPATSREHEDYTIAWICALHLELRASVAMLDEKHPSLPIHEGDDNAYVLGRIHDHDVVMACLPGQYGTNNAAIVATNLKRSFPRIRATLMVGIGGGSPSMADMCLGDVVVATRVMQYDLGKMVEGGRFQITADAKIPAPLLMSAATSLRAKHDHPEYSGQTALILQQRLPGHIRPSQPDRLFKPTYQHPFGASSCDDCDPDKIQPRRERPTSNPRIHYGVIASGNMVMRNATSRDEIARQLTALCFEMEASGLMDNLQCLPIRGICDYSDSHKNKMWQDYAAGTAAAYARELIEEIPPTFAMARRNTLATEEPDDAAAEKAKMARRHRLLDLLNFEQIAARKTTIKSAHAKTCRWFLSHPAYEAWLNPAAAVNTHGFLWLKGKAGAGKSTLMKFLNLQTKEMFEDEPDVTVASFFFNARGDRLEQGIEGMYRSLLLQLLESFADLQSVLDNTDVVPSEHTCPSLNSLKDLLSAAVFRLRKRRFICFVDALDECDEHQAQDMIRYFEQLAESATERKVQLRICFSSRPYPFIDINSGTLLVLEEEPGHGRDMGEYVQKELRINNAQLSHELQASILDKASGIFMWVVLVVDILNRENRRGSLSLKRKLASIPAELSDLFRSMLIRDHEDTEALRLCIIWILCARRPLSPEEFYHALWIDLSRQNLVDPECPDADTEACARLVTSSSKGLAEATRSVYSKVQFIHESVRDFLVRDRGLQDLWPDLGFDWEGSVHERLTRCCLAYLNHPDVKSSMREFWPARGAFPFLDYAKEHVIHHANATALVIPSAQCLSQLLALDLSQVVTVFAHPDNAGNFSETPVYNQSTTNLYILADHGCANLIRIVTVTEVARKESLDRVPGQRFKYPLFVAIANNHLDAVVALLGLPPTSDDAIAIRSAMAYMVDDISGDIGRTPLTWAVEENIAEVAVALLRLGADVNEADENSLTPLLVASKRGNEAMVQLMIDHGADVSIRDSLQQTALMLAVQNGYETVARRLVDHGSDVDARNRSCETPLMMAVKDAPRTVARSLIDRCANGEAGNSVYEWEELMSSAPFSNFSLPNMVRILVDKGANPNARDLHGHTALTLLSPFIDGYEEVLRCLVDGGADVNACAPYGDTALRMASGAGNERAMQYLLRKGGAMQSQESFVGGAH